MVKKLDITSTAVEKGLELAKDFLNKLMFPSVEETGLFLKEKVASLRFKNQVKMLIKAKEICERNGISPKSISLKLLCPLIEYAGLEEDEILQDKWANLLVNMVDSEQNIENHVFPYILSQVSLEEFMLIESVYKIKVERQSKQIKELEEFLSAKQSIESNLKTQIEQLEAKMKTAKEQQDQSHTTWEFHHQKMDLEKQLREIETKERTIRYHLEKPEFVPSKDLKEYEVSNLIRLGLIKNIPRPYAYVGKNQAKIVTYRDYISLEDLEIVIEAEDDDLILTELGELFIAACSNMKVYKQVTSVQNKF